MSKEYPVPEEIKELFIEERALTNCRDAAIKSVFGYRRSIKYAKEREKVCINAWRLTMTLYPHLEDKKVSYNHIKGVLVTDE